MRVRARRVGRRDATRRLADRESPGPSPYPPRRVSDERARAAAAIAALSRALVRRRPRACGLGGSGERSRGGARCQPRPAMAARRLVCRSIASAPRRFFPRGAATARAMARRSAQATAMAGRRRRWRPRGQTWPHRALLDPAVDQLISCTSWPASGPLNAPRAFRAPPALAMARWFRRLLASCVSADAAFPVAAVWIRLRSASSGSMPRPRRRSSAVVGDGLAPSSAIWAAPPAPAPRRDARQHGHQLPTHAVSFSIETAALDGPAACRARAASARAARRACAASRRCRRAVHGVVGRRESPRAHPPAPWSPESG